MTSYYDANGHYARVMPVFSPTQLDRVQNKLIAIPPRQRLAGLRARHAARLPGRRHPAVARRFGPVAVRGCDPTATPVRGPTRAMRRLVYIGLAVALLPWIVIGDRARGHGRRHDGPLLRARDVRQRLVARAGRGREGRRRAGGRDPGPGRDAGQEGRGHAAHRQHGLHARGSDDAHCKIGAQGLIGEKFVDCQPGSSVGRRRCRAIETGDGKGERLLPVDAHSSPVDLDLLNDILRLPYRQRFAILLNEFGTGLAGRGEDLNEVIHRANPALRETDQVLKILAEPEPRAGAAGARLDQALAPLAREREHVRRLHRPGERDRRGLRRAARRPGSRASSCCPASCASCGR